MACGRKLSPLVALLHPPGVPCVLTVSSARYPALARGNLLQLIGMLDSPYVRRVAIALIMAKTPFIHRPISLFRHIDQFSKVNPLLKAPTLVTDAGVALMVSSVILDYLAGAHRRAGALDAA